MARDGTESPDSFLVVPYGISNLRPKTAENWTCYSIDLASFFFWYLEWYLEPMLSQLLPEISGSFLQLSWGILALFHLAKCVLKPVGRIHPIYTDHHWSTGCHRISLGILQCFLSCLVPSVVQVDHHHQVTSQRAHAARWQVDGWAMANAEIKSIH